MNSTASSPLLFVPLIPPSLTYLDIVLPPLLISLSLLLHTIYNDPTPPTVHAHVYRANTAHARYLPVESKHVFSYPALFFGIDLGELEEGNLDIGRLLRYNKKSWAVTALKPESYLEAGAPTRKGEGDQPHPPLGIREKLWRQLEKHGVSREEAEMIYTVTMPAYLGTEGINPLTTHYCYAFSEREDGAGLERVWKATVLEVHNTFGERHIYVLKNGKDEDDELTPG